MSFEQDSEFWGLSQTRCQPALLTELAREIEPPNLWEELGRLMSQIPHGRVTTYGAVATALGDVSAARWVAQMLRSDSAPADWPTHRVVLRDGSLGAARGAGSDARCQRLQDEGIATREGRVELTSQPAVAVVGSAPLRSLRRQQSSVGEGVREWGVEVKLSQPQRRWVGGVDVSYGRREGFGPQPAIAAFVLYDREQGQTVWSCHVSGQAVFPYLPGYLAFREVRLMRKAVELARDAGRLPAVVFVDGNGVLHPRGAGIATLLGCAANCITVGIGKHLLCGQQEPLGGQPGSRGAVTVEGRLAGTAIRPRWGASPYYVSCGVGVDQATAADLACSIEGAKGVPMPIQRAHEVATLAARRMVGRAD